MIHIFVDLLQKFGIVSNIDLFSENKQMYSKS